MTDAAARGDLDHWLARAAGEHASVASFARASLDLMALGAPADLVARTHAAALDEIEHARIAYGIASRIKGQPLGPGPLPLPPARVPTFALLVTETFRDACIEETLGTLALREEAVGNPVLERIADDEERHAELAWATLAWLVRAGGADARAALERALRVLETPDFLKECAALLLASTAGEAPRIS